MKRRTFLAAGAAAPLAQRGWTQAPGPHPISEPHFPSRLYQFVWRNWELANADRMALVAGASPEAILELGRSLGLPPKPRLLPDQLERIYITVIRQNWHLLPLEQIQQLLNWSREKLQFTLKEDDFLDVKLGPKPVCEPLSYQAPSAAARLRAGEIRQALRSTVGADLEIAGEPAFHFVQRLSSRRFESLRDSAASVPSGFIDLTGWSVRGSGAAEPVAARFAEYLRDAMAAAPVGESPRILSFQLAGGGPPAAEAFRVSVDDDRISVTASNVNGLFQGSYWLQHQMESSGGPFLPKGRFEKQAALDPRYLYSYFALYGDPLLETAIDPFPEGYLEKLGKVGINGVWMQCVLNNMAPSRIFPEFGKRSDERLANLRELVRRAGRAGLKIYLYVNEPRAMPAAFFRSRPEMQGAGSHGVYAMCTSAPQVREWMSDSLAHIFERVPDLGGVFSITMSENLTNCFSKFHPEQCPRCSKRTSWDTVGEVIETIRSGVRRASPPAEVIVWDWGWPEDLCRNLIPKLPRDVRYSSVSEWSTPIDRGGVHTRVGEYSISVVGPGPRATANWKLARHAGIRTMAKAQFNNTWEISAVPFIPVPNLVARHCENLLRSGISAIQASWTLGGYPSPNLEAAREFYFSPPPEAGAVLEHVAVRRYGKRAAPTVLEAWAGFSKAFELYPYSVAIYLIPTQHGPANLLRARPTGVRGSMILFPQDDYRRWSGQYPPAVAQREFARMAALWEEALPLFRKAVGAIPASRRRQAGEDLAIAETCGIHFRSTANQLEFYILRDSPAAPGRLARMREIAREEIDLARRLYPLARRNSVIAYEASNHYYYRPTDLLEKILNCRYLLDNDLKENANG